MSHLKSVSTIKLKIPANKLLLEAMGEYSRCISCIADIGFNSSIINRYKLHHAAYHEARKRFKLKSQFIINAIRVASQTLKSVKANKGSKPMFRQFMPLDFDRRTFTFSSNKIRLTTINNRIDIPIEIPEYYWKYLDWSYQTARITYDKRGMFIHITFTRNINAAVSTGNSIGIDLGINHVAVTSKKQFFSGSKVKNVMLNFKHLRAKLQAKGTKSAKKLPKFPTF